MIRKMKPNKIYKENILELLGGLFLLCLLFNNYFRNAFSIVPQTWFSDWQRDSESIITSSINYARSNGILCNYGLLYGYAPQIGLQGLVFKVLDHLIQRPWMSLDFLHGFVVSSLCILIYVFMSWVRREFNLWAALIVYLSFFFNRWMIVSARNLYWVVATLLLPFVGMLLLAERDEKRQTKIKLWVFAWTSFITVFLRMACGFEMTSCVMVSATLPIFYYACKNKWGWKLFWARFCACAFGALSSFGLAIVINGLQQALYYRSLQYAIDNILRTVSKRTGFFNIEVDPILNSSLEASKWSVVKSYLLDGSPVIGGAHMITLIWIFGVALGISLVSGIYSFEIEKNRKRLQALCLMTSISFMGPLSWYILASPHSYIHTHINYILWSFPCMPLIFTTCGYEISCLCRDNTKRVKRWGVPLFVLLSGVILYFYADSCKVGNKYVKLVRSEGALIYDGEYADMYFYKDYLYYMIQRGHENKRIFLHLYPSETDMEFANEYGFVNNDFAFSENELKLPIWEPKKVSRISLDKEYSIFRIATGQFDEFGREWETDFELSDYINMPEKIIPDSLTDSNWTNGIKNDGTVILMKAENELVFHLLEGKSLKAESGKVVYVKQVVQQGEWMHIILNEPLDVSDGYPHAFQVLTGR